MVSLKHRRREAVRLRVEEVEPRVVPSGGDWHTLIQAGKALAQEARQDPGVLAGLVDPFCNGTDPGPCAAPDAQHLRNQLDQLSDTLWNDEHGRYNDLQDAQAHLTKLEIQHAPDPQVLAAELKVDYTKARETQISLDLWGLGEYNNVPNNQLVAWSRGLIDAWIRKGADAAQAEKQAEHDFHQAAMRQDFDGIANATHSLASNQGYFDQEVEDVQFFNYYVSQ